jgi:hypothetical protein
LNGNDYKGKRQFMTEEHTAKSIVNWPFFWFYSDLRAMLIPQSAGRKYLSSGTDAKWSLNLMSLSDNALTACFTCAN